MSRKPCGREVSKGGVLVYTGPSGGEQRQCHYERMKGKQTCRWHWLMRQPADVQSKAAEERREIGLLGRTGPRARVPESEWPEGARFCAGCQSMVPLFYTTGSRCKACASAAAHASRVQSTYGISKEQYDALFEAQGGRCFICQRRPRTLRLAVDHDHATGEVRGLLCANNENGCNRGVVANLEAAHDGGLAAAKRAVLYLAAPPHQRTGVVTWESFLRAELARIDARVNESGRVPPCRKYDEPPF